MKHLLLILVLLCSCIGDEPEYTETAHRFCDFGVACLGAEYDIDVCSTFAEQCGDIDHCFLDEYPRGSCNDVRICLVDACEE